MAIAGISTATERESNEERLSTKGDSPAPDQFLVAAGSGR
jgi:hypothetical protein